MSKIIDRSGILQLAERLVYEEYRGVLDQPEDFLGHTAATYDIAGETVGKILSKYPQFRDRLDREMIQAAGGLHDIGRPLEKDQTFHGLRGAMYIKDKWRELKIADSKETVDIVIQMFLPHGLAYEEFTEPSNSRMKCGFESLDHSCLLPSTWQEAIIVYADGSNIGGKKVDIQSRFEESMKKYRKDPRYFIFYEMLARGGKDRMLRVCKNVTDLSKGDLSEAQIKLTGLSFEPRRLAII